MPASGEGFDRGFGMRALWLGATIAALGAGICAGAAKADGLVVKRSDPYVYVAPDAVPIVYDWTGIYFGGHAGLAIARNELTYDDPDPVLGFFFNSGDSHASFAGGGHIGLQKQWSWIVVGAEVAWTYMNEAEHIHTVIPLDRTFGIASRDVLTVTGRFGWAWDNILAYFKGGYATTQIDYSSRVIATGVLSTASEREHGWTAGAGLEYALWQHVILGVEYNYIKFNADRDLVGTGVVPPATLTDSGIDIQSVTARLSFKFGGGRPEPAIMK
jgi:outer membrane immunogenic protein